MHTGATCTLRVSVEKKLCLFIQNQRRRYIPKISMHFHCVVQVIQEKRSVVLPEPTLSERIGTVKASTTKVGDGNWNGIGRVAAGFACSEDPASGTLGRATTDTHTAVVMSASRRAPVKTWPWSISEAWASIQTPHLLHFRASHTHFVRRLCK